jgi:amidohydrolase
LDRFKKTVSSVAEGMGCQVEIDIQRLTPAVINDPKVARLVQETVKTLLPKAMVDSSNYVTMGSEDMAYIMEKVPSCFIFIGSANPDKNLDASHHHPKFDIDEDILPDAVAILAQAALNFLQK